MSPVLVLFLSLGVIWIQYWFRVFHGFYLLIQAHEFKATSKANCLSEHRVIICSVNFLEQVLELVWLIHYLPQGRVLEFHICRPKTWSQFDILVECLVPEQQINKSGANDWK